MPHPSDKQRFGGSKLSAGVWIALLAWAILPLTPNLGWAIPIPSSIEDESGIHQVPSPPRTNSAASATPSTSATVGGCSTVNLAVNTAAGDQFSGAQIPDGAGGTIIAWEDYRDGATNGWDVYAQHVLACGAVDPTWPAGGVAISTAPGDQRFPLIASDGSGGAFVVWNEQWTYPATTGNEEIYAQHVLSTGVVDPSWPANGLGVTTAPGTQIIPYITSDGNHGAYVTWDNVVAGARRVFVQHLLSTGVDPAWTVNGVRACTVQFAQAGAVICSDGSGGAIVAWNDGRSGALGVNIFAQRMSSTGALLWSPTGQPVCQAPGRQALYGGSPAGGNFYLNNPEAQGAALVPDGAGGCLISWVDDRTFSTTVGDVYAQRLTSSGAVAAGWPVDGVALCTALGPQGQPVIVSDGSGGAIATWRDGARTGVFVQHVSGAGVVDGPVNGLVISSPASPFDVAECVSDGGSGAILSWSDTRNGGLDAFALHVTTSPSLAVDPAWPVDGTALSTAGNDQLVYNLGDINSDGAGGAIVTWSDTRDFSASANDIYAQAVSATGVLPTFSVTGQVLANCPSPNTGLVGVTVDAYLVGSGDLASSSASGSGGSYTVSGLCWGGQYTLSTVTPLGYAAAAGDLAANGCAGPVDFAMSCLTASGTPRSMGFWKHQVGVATGGNGHADIDGATLCSYLDLIAAHFNSNVINQVIVYQPPGSGLCADKLQVAKTLLNLPGSVAMIARARQQLMALLLNVAAGYVGQTQVISADGATVSQAITYSDNQIDSPTGNYERAKTICDDINNGVQVPAGMIPLSTQNISYAAGRGALAFRVTPNPGRALRFQFSVQRAGPVDLTVFDVTGRVVAELVHGPMAAGSHSVTWDRAPRPGAASQQGVYFARLTTRDGVGMLRVLKL